MQRQRGAVGSFPDSLGYEHGSALSDDVNAPSDIFSDYISLNVTNEDDRNEDMWNVEEPEPQSSMLPLGDHGSSSSSFSEPFEADDHRVSRKRKAAELSIGQSSSGGLNLDPTIPRLGLNVGRVRSESPSAENAHRNVRRISSSSRQELLANSINNNNDGQPDVLDPYSSLRLDPNDFRSPPVEETSDEDDPVIPERISALIRYLQSFPEESRSSASRANRSSNQDSISDHTLFAPPSNVRNPVQSDVLDPYSSLRLDPNDSRSPPVEETSDGDDPVIPERISALIRHLQSFPRESRSSASRANRSSNQDSVSDHTLFARPSNVRNGAQAGLSWSPNRGGDDSVNDGGSVGDATSRAETSSDPSPNYHPRRLTAFLRRSLLTSTDLEAGGGQNSLLPRIPPVLSASSLSSSSSRDTGIPPLDNVHGHHSRSPLLVARQLEGGVAFYPSQRMTGGIERRGRLVSEIRSVLDSMRRGEALRFEDRMLLDQSMFYGIADNHDRHRDMRLDIDDMSYEELLALEERIGNVDTGLTEEKIVKHLKQKQYPIKTRQPETEPCCICQEEYKDGDDLGSLECEHHFHHGCIKQWLRHKNSCPICKSTGFAAAK